MIYSSGLDLIMGTGHPLYDDDGLLRSVPNYLYVGSSEVWSELNLGTAGNDSNGDGVFDSWRIVVSKEDFLSLSEGKISGRIFAIASVFKTLQEKRSGAVNDSVPSLRVMASGTLRLFVEGGDDFFLVIEGGAIDFAGHDNNLPRMIEELSDFNDAVAAVVDYLGSTVGWEGSLVLVTADHETGYLMSPNSGPPDSFSSVVNNGEGVVPFANWYSASHTKLLVPLYAKGLASGVLDEFIVGKDQNYGIYVDNTAIYDLVTGMY